MKKTTLPKKQAGGSSTKKLSTKALNNNTTVRKKAPYSKEREVTLLFGDRPSPKDPWTRTIGGGRSSGTKATKRK